MVSQASRVMRGLKEIGGNPDLQVLGERMVLKGSRGRRGWLARRVPQARLGRRASLACRVFQVIQDVQALRDLLAFRDPWGH